MVARENADSALPVPAQILTSPDFYMSGYLEANREEYQERLRAVSRDGDWTGWCAFFLKGSVNRRPKMNVKPGYPHSMTGVRTGGRSDPSPHAIRAVEFIFRRPFSHALIFYNHSKIPKPTANRILTSFGMKDFDCTFGRKRRRAGIYAFSGIAEYCRRDADILSLTYETQCHFVSHIRVQSETQLRNNESIDETQRYERSRNPRRTH